MEIEEIKILVSKWAEENPLIRKAFIYGSRAKNTHSETSDLDVAVLLNLAGNDKNEFTTWSGEKTGLENSLQKIIPLKVHLEWIDTEESGIVGKGVIESGILVYEQSKP